MITKVGKTEGQLNLIAWEGYTYKQWVNPFQKATGCKVHSKFGGSSDEMVTLMRTGQYDAVSASGDASLRLIFGKDVRPIDPKLIPDFKNFIPALKSPSHNTVKGVHYGISLQWGPEHAPLQHEEGEARPELVERALQLEVQGQGHDPGQPDPDRGRRALPVEEQAGPRDQGPVRADRSRSSTQRSTC
jgi:putative spermidine/putrescine transport system substrate-binding protein